MATKKKSIESNAVPEGYIASPEMREGDTIPVSEVSDTIDHTKNPDFYHEDQLARMGAGACDVCGKPVDAKPDWMKTSGCTRKFHAQQLEQFGAGACTVCGHNVAQ